MPKVSISATNILTRAILSFDDDGNNNTSQNVDSEIGS
jgi:hypothetical protein